ncbi:claudin-15 [Huso huso]|uniref:Claudin n=1 Tax=Huso huso TaxID=61971 RepID=A0ABR0Z092_HUSHU
MDSAVEVVAFILGFIAWIMLGVCIPYGYWKVSTVDGSVITTSTIYENLWMSCASDATGLHNCREFPSLLALSGYLQASRALMITALVAGTLGNVAAMVGLKCTKVGGDNYVFKGRVAGVGGVCYLVEGLCAMVAISWYAFNITREFFDPLYPGTKYEIGPALYIGWCAGTMALIGGCCLCCSCNQGTADKQPAYYLAPRGTIMSATQASRITKSPSEAGGTNYGRNAYV